MSPERIDGWELRGELARGAQGTVFRAFDLRLQREVALKLLREAFDAPALTRFEREARLAARLRHPNAVAIHAAGSWEGRPYLVMDLVRGESLQERIDRVGALEPREAVRIAARLAAVLAAAHALGVLHRDVKPANVLLADDGEPLLTDFGLARELAGPSASSMTADGTPVGTPAYWAPEQARADRAALGPRTDVFALGGVLFTLLTGGLPLVARTLAGICEELRRSPRPPSAERPGLDPALDQLVLRCLARRPEERPVGAAELAAAFEDWLADSGADGAAPAPEPTPRLRRGERGALVAALLFTLALPTALTGWLEARAGVRELRVEVDGAAAARLEAEGWAAAGNDDLPGARELARRARELAPERSGPWALAARVELSANDPAGLGHAAEAVRLEPGSVLALSLLGLVQARVTGDRLRAAVALERARAEETRDARSLGYRGLLSAEQARMSEALADLDRSLQLDPGDRELWGSRATVRARAGNLPGAAADYERAFELGPPRLRDLAGAGEAALMLGNLEDARRIYANARAHHGDAFTVLLGEGNLALVDQRWELALERFDRAAALDPKSPGPPTGRVQALHALRRLDEARAALEALRAAHPDRAQLMDQQLPW